MDKNLDIDTYSNRLVIMNTATYKENVILHTAVQKESNTCTNTWRINMSGNMAGMSGIAYVAQGF
jgi:hypothetical protein